MEAIDVLYAYKEVRSIVSVLQSLRAESEEGFSRMFGETSCLGRDLHGDSFELTMPRINRRQTQRSNVQASTAEQYYRITLYNEFLSHVIAELEERFVKSPPQCVGLLHLLPWECSSTATDTTDTTDNMLEDLATAVEFYEEDLPHSVMLPTEYRLWSAKWRQHKERLPKKLVDVFLSFDKMTFPNIKVLLHLTLTVRITSWESE